MTEHKNKIAVLYRGDRETRRDATVRSFRDEFPSRLHSAGPRVLKQNRGNGGQGVWKVEALSMTGDSVRVVEARRGSVPEDWKLADFMTRCEAYFTPDGCIVD